MYVRVLKKYIVCIHTYIYTVYGNMTVVLSFDGSHLFFTPLVVVVVVVVVALLLLVK